MGILDWFMQEATREAPLPNEAELAEAGRNQTRLMKTMASAVPRMVTAPIEAVQGIDQIVSAFGQNSGNIAENLQRGRYRQGGFEKVQEFLAQKQAEWQEANPDATPEQVKEFVSKYQNSPEYIAAERQQLPDRLGLPIYRKNEEVADAIDKAVGVPSDNLKTNTEQLAAAGAQAAIPVGLAKSLPTAARLAAEFILPGNQAKSTAGKLAVGGTAAGITGGVQALTGREVKPQEYEETLEPEPVPVAAIKFPELNTADGVEPVTLANAADQMEYIANLNKVVPATASLGIFAALGAALTGSRAKVLAGVNTDAPVVPSKPGVVGPTVGTNAKDAVAAVKDVANFALDERDPIKRAIQQSEGSYKEGVQASNEIGIHSPSAAGTSKRNHAEFGFLGDQQVTPLARLDNMRTVLKDNSEWEPVSNYLLARSELSNRSRYVDELQEDINKAYLEHTAAVEAKNVPKANDVLGKISKLQDDLNERLSKRFQMQQYSTEQLDEMIKAGPGDEIAQRYVQAYDQNNNAWMKQLEKDGLIEPELVARIKSVHDGSYAPMIADELNGATGVSRLFGKIGLAARKKADDSAERLSARVNPFSNRDISAGAEGADFLMDPHNALFKRSNQYHNWREQQLYVRDSVERILAGKNADDVIEEKLTGAGGRTAFSDAEAMALANKRDLSGFTPVKLTENKGKTTFVKFKDPLLARALEAGPMSSTIFGTVKHMLQRGATGTWNLGFAPMSTMLENAGIQLMRPRGSIGFIDNAVYRAGKAAGVDIDQSALDAIGMMTKPADILIGQADAMVRTANLFWKMNRIRIADNMLAGLETGSGWFGSMMAMPAFRAFAMKWAPKVVDTFHDTIEGSLVDGKGMTLNTLTRSLEHTRELEKFMDVHVPPSLRMVGNAAGEPFRQTKMMISAYRDAAKWSHYNRQYSYQALRHGGEDKIPDETIKKMMNEVRTLTGDYTKRMGQKGMQSFDDAIPYLRVMVQSTKNAYQRVISDPLLATSVMSGLVLPKVAFEYEMANWDKEAYDWYYRQTNAYDRAQFIGFVRPDIWYRRHVLGEEVPFSPDHVYKLFSPQEWRPLVEATSQAIRGLGGYSAGQKDRVADTTAGTQIGHALAQAFTPSMPPPLAAILAAGGVRLDPSGIFTGENVVRTQSNPNKINEQLAMDSNITKGMHDTLGALFGNIGKSLMQGYSSGEHIYKKTGKIDEAIFGGAQEAAERISTSRAMPLPWVGDANNRRYRQTPTTAELYKMRKAFSVVQGSRTGGKAYTPEDPMLAAIADELRNTGKSYEPKDFSKRYQELDTNIKRIENTRTIPYGQRQKMQENDLKQLHQLSIEQNKWMLQQEKRIALMEIQPGMKLTDVYQRQFGVPFTLKDYGQRVEAMKQKQGK